MTGRTAPWVRSPTVPSQEAPVTARAGSVAIQLPHSRMSSPLPQHRVVALGDVPRFTPQAAKLHQSQPKSSTLQSHPDLVKCQCQRVQSNGDVKAASGISSHQQVIENELQAFQKILVAEKEAAVNQIRAVSEAAGKTGAANQLRARLEAESGHYQELAKQLGNLETRMHLMEGGLRQMDSRLSAVASQQTLSQSENHQFADQALDFFESFETSLHTLQHKLQVNNILPDDAWLAFAKAEDTCSKLDMLVKAERTCSKFDAHGSKVKGAPSETTSASPSCASFTAHENGSLDVPDWCPMSSPAKAETSIRIEVLELALASMQQHEHEQIRLLQERIRGLREEKATMPWQNSMQHGIVVGS